MIDIESAVTSVNEFIQILEKWTPGDKTKAGYFRGESQLYDTPFLPKIWRQDHQWSKEGDWELAGQETVLTTVELEVLAHVQDAYDTGKLNDPYFTKYGRPSDGSVDWLFLAQHHGCPTRLIDVSYDPLVALYFACVGNDGMDGWVYFSEYGYNEWGPDQHSEQIQDLFDIHEIEDAIDGKYPIHPDDETGFLFLPLASNQRMILQGGRFLWCRKQGSAPARVSTTKVRVDADHKSSIAAQLRRWGHDRHRFPTPTKGPCDP